MMPTTAATPAPMTRRRARSSGSLVASGSVDSSTTLLMVVPLLAARTRGARLQAAFARAARSSFHGPLGLDVVALVLGHVGQRGVEAAAQDAYPGDDRPAVLDRDLLAVGGHVADAGADRREDLP